MAAKRKAPNREYPVGHSGVHDFTGRRASRIPRRQAPCLDVGCLDLTFAKSAGLHPSADIGLKLNSIVLFALARTF